MDSDGTATQIQIRDALTNRDVPVKVFGWIHRILRHDNEGMVVLLRDGTGFLKCVFSDQLYRMYSGVAREASVCIYGKISAIPEDNAAPDGLELSVDFLEVIGTSPQGGVDEIVSKCTSTEDQLDHRHLMLRQEEMSKTMRLRSFVIQCFRAHYVDRGYIEVTPPTLVPSAKFEVAEELFSVNFFDGNVNLTQSSQLYLETVIPFLGDVFCVAPSYRVEHKQTRRHLSEFTHIEAECPFISFDDLVYRLEDAVCDVIERIMKSPYRKIVQDLHPNFKPPERPFKKMSYGDAIEFLQNNGIKKDDGTFCRFGEDISESLERSLIGIVNKPLLLCRFPTKIKPFYMQPCSDDSSLTESVDLLLPNVGEIAGGSMRVWKHDDIMEGFRREGTDPTNYYWYTDQRKFGSCPHGGYGIGFERFLCWLLNRYNIREVVLYPRFVGRSSP
ncbi:asparagine--tRNA ligase, cytoplasmic-like [Pecten maximus]|uniref:asparagine--tRNA ligase, cytoplasmic-like n=1 Tax=Pecten maximus TaxID=6579 RepID=UPI0014581AB0|nr:asparagine--tRNA ligase, cytoplasmic-like [Pecten maximus]